MGCAIQVSSTYIRDKLCHIAHMYHTCEELNWGVGGDNNFKDAESRGCFLLVLILATYVTPPSTLFLLNVSSIPYPRVHKSLALVVCIQVVILGRIIGPWGTRRKKDFGRDASTYYSIRR